MWPWCVSVALKQQYGEEWKFLFWLRLMMVWALQATYRICWIKTGGRWGGHLRQMLSTLLAGYATAIFSQNTTHIHLPNSMQYGALSNNAIVEPWIANRFRSHIWAADIISRRHEYWIGYCPSIPSFHSFLLLGYCEQTFSHSNRIITIFGNYHWCLNHDKYSCEGSFSDDCI